VTTPDLARQGKPTFQNRGLVTGLAVMEAIGLLLLGLVLTGKAGIAGASVLSFAVLEVLFVLGPVAIYRNTSILVTPDAVEVTNPIGMTKRVDRSSVALVQRPPRLGSKVTLVDEQGGDLLSIPVWPWEGAQIDDLAQFLQPPDQALR
jgi:hypothetical protein